MLLALAVLIIGYKLVIALQASEDRYLVSLLIAFAALMIGLRLLLALEASEDMEY